MERAGEGGLPLTQERIDAYLTSLPENKRSLAARCLRMLYDTLAEPREITLPVMADMRRVFLEKGYAPNTKKRYMWQLNGFLRWSGRADLVLKGDPKDLSGQRFGRLTVLEPTWKRDEADSFLWRCRCDCGREVELPARQLSYGAQMSCGAHRHEKMHESNMQIGGTNLRQVFSDRPNRNSQSGHRGVFLHRGRWEARIKYRKKTYYLGAYKNLEDALDARREAEIRIREEAEELLREFQTRRE